ncbi:MAG TPA: aquaporin [Actinomycetota bacterium]|nr:aquaporin [Actinomycetota bacterium]
MEGTGKAAVAEFVATFALVFVGAGAVILNANGQIDLTGVALAHGLVLAIMVSVTVHISGGMVNPAVAVSLWVTGKVSTPRAGALIVAQLAGAIAGAFLLEFLVPAELFGSGNGGIPALGDGVTIGKGILIEAVTTFFLVFAFFGTIVDDRGPFSKTAGLTIGLVIAFDIMAFGPYTGAATNPARWLGPALATTDWADWYVWIVGPIAGGIIAGVLYWSVFLKDKEPATP